MTFNSPTYREKLMLSIAGFLFLSILAYKQSIKGTLVIYKECERLESELSMQNEIEDQINFYQNALQNQNMFAGIKNTDDRLLQKVLLDEIAAYCKGKPIELSNYKVPHLYGEEKFSVNTQIFTVKGDYQSLLKLIYYLERNFDLSRISSVSFYRQKDRKTGKNNLYATIYLQKISVT